MENKYYVPEIDEFHVGFEYEYVTNIGVTTDDDSKWDSFLFGDQEKFKSWDWRLLLQDCLKRKLIRVKHLDREDIESLGWIFNHKVIINDEGSLYVDSWVINIDKTENKRKYFQLYLNDGKYYISYIEYTNSVGRYESDIFQGTIKNKSELTKILAQLNILKKS